MGVGLRLALDDSRLTAKICWGGAPGGRLVPRLECVVGESPADWVGLHGIPRAMQSACDTPAASGRAQVGGPRGRSAPTALRYPSKASALGELAAHGQEPAGGWWNS